MTLPVLDWFPDSFVSFHSQYDCKVGGATKGHVGELVDEIPEKPLMNVCMPVLW